MQPVALSRVQVNPRAMACTMLASKTMCRPGAFGLARPVQAPRPSSRTLIVSNSYKNLENINLSKLPQFARHETDTGSSEYQVARLTARIEQLSGHLQKNKKDFSAKRGLQAILAQRKVLLQYLYRQDRSSYDNIIKSFGIRSVVVGDTRGASRQKAEL